ncbi:hypothetical protein PGB90_010092 [Kerria lacca]
MAMQESNDVCIRGDSEGGCNDVDEETSRKFSSGDLSSELDDEEAAQQGITGTSNIQPSGQSTKQKQYGSTRTDTESGFTQSGGGDMSLNLNKSSSKTISAPTSPAKTRESLLQRVQSLTGVARDQGASLIGAVTQSASSVRQQTYNKDKHFTLLVIDDSQTDWSKCFKGRKLHGDYDIRVEQAQFKDISVTCNVQEGLVVSIPVYRTGSKVLRVFRPNFVLVRQNLRDAGENYKSLLFSFMYAGIPSINSLNAIYNFQMNSPKYPVVFKVGHSHGGLGKAKAENNTEFQDLTSMVAVSCSYVTTEPFIDSKYDLHIQKIGSNYRAFTRRSLTGSWKTNIGSSIVESAPVSDRHKLWIDESSELFGGLDICALEIVVAKDGREYIIELNDSALTLMGDTQDEDRRLIADIVLQRMQMYCRPPLVKSMSRSSLTGQSQVYNTGDEEEDRSHSSTVAQLRRDSETSQASVSSQPQSQATRTLGRQSSQTGSIGSVEDYEDTMKNLRKTFAGIFGDDK